MNTEPIRRPARPTIERLSVEVDIACAGFGPAMGGFLTTLCRAWTENPADPALESRVMPGMPLQILCYERADDIATGVSGVVTQARGIRASFPSLDPAQIPMAVPSHERARALSARPHRRQPPLLDFALRRFSSRSWTEACG